MSHRIRRNFRSGNFRCSHWALTLNGYHSSSRNMSKHKNPHAVALGKRAAGIPKKFTPDDLARRAAHARQMTVNRVAQKKLKKIVDSSQ